ncbi:calumenin-like [Zingiber officinale]|uniref:calumenin-like n=1 Tax=Zingiber officinale TaxID=94328 RepID=UPI001C4B9D47|nr:calumenin-like [Zingiber officinale]
MARSSLVVYLSVAIFVLFLLSFAPSQPNRPHRRLKLRSAAGLSAPLGRDRRSVHFDPIIVDIERRRDDREWERSHYFPDGHAPTMEPQPEWKDFMDAEDYINDEAQFNVTHRIVELFPKIDVGPADGFITVDELAEWNLRQVKQELMHQTQRDMELHDKNHDGFISFTEYEPPRWARRLHDDNSSDNKMGWWQEEHFNASDMDGDGLLNLTEFNDYVCLCYILFLHPSDSSNPKVFSWLAKEEIRENDKDKDGKLNFQEYFNGLFQLIRRSDDVHNFTLESDTSAEVPAKKLFSQLDHDNDSYLSEDELLPVIGDLHPSERYYAKQQAEYAVMEADTDKDGRLSMKEMIENPYVLYTSIHTEDNHYDFHDEFR